MRPELLILDEPFESMDPLSKRELIDLLNRLHDERGMSFVFSTHEVNIVPLVADRVYVLSREGSSWRARRARPSPSATCSIRSAWNSRRWPD